MLASALLMALIGALLGLVLGAAADRDRLRRARRAAGRAAAEARCSASRSASSSGCVVDEPALAGGAHRPRLPADRRVRLPQAPAGADHGRGRSRPRSCATWSRSRRARATSAPTTSSSWRRCSGGTFARNPPDVGILASLDALDGPTFDAAPVHPLIREFYEHTSRFKLSIVPEWRTWMKPAYELFKQVVAEPLGQATIPSNIEEAQRGMVSTIDTISLRRQRGDRHPRLDPDLRRLGQADLRRHLHELPPRGPRLRQRRLPDPELELHRHAAAAQRRRRRPAADLALRPRVPRPLPERGRGRRT